MSSVCFLWEHAVAGKQHNWKHTSLKEKQGFHP